MYDNKSKQIISENMLTEITGGAQARDADVGRATPAGEGDLVTPVSICTVCNNLILSTDRQCVICKTDSSFGGV